MLALPELQDRMISAILVGNASPLHGAVAPLRLGAEARLQIYRNHFAVSLIEALGRTYPVLQRLVGEAFFAQAARRFIASWLPSSPCLHEYGAEFPGFVATLARSADFAYLADVGGFEWAINVAYHADDVPPLSATALQSVPAADLANLRLVVHPSVRLIQSAYPLLRIWRANQPEADSRSVDLGAGGVNLLLGRQHVDVIWRELDSAALAFYGRLFAAQSLGQACEALITSGGDAGAAGPLLADLFVAGFVTGISNATQTER